MNIVEVSFSFYNRNLKYFTSKNKVKNTIIFDGIIIFFSVLTSVNFNSRMDGNQCSCTFCDLPTYYYCVKCHKPVCNRPDCSSPVSESFAGYSEMHPKSVGICKPCSGTKKRQSSLSAFFKSRYWYSYIILLANVRFEN